MWVVLKVISVCLRRNLAMRAIDILSLLFKHFLIALQNSKMFSAYNSWINCVDNSILVKWTDISWKINALNFIDCPSVSFILYLSNRNWNFRFNFNWRLLYVKWSRIKIKKKIFRLWTDTCLWTDYCLWTNFDI